MPRNIYDYNGPPKVDYDEHPYYEEEVLRTDYNLPKLNSLWTNTTDSEQLHVAVSGGSMGGLFTAVGLRQAGYDVDVFERTASGEMEDRGAGIIAHPEMIEYLKKQGIADPTDVSITTDHIQYFDQESNVISEIESEILTTSWDTVYRGLRDAISNESYHMGRRVVNVDQSDDSVTVEFEARDDIDADLFVAAEGYRSSTRQQFLPDVSPEYAGYIAWRGLMREQDLSSDLASQFRDVYSFYHGPDFQILVYPVPGPNGETTKGERRINWVWYWNVPQEQLDDLLTDKHGTQHEYSLPPGMMRDQVRQHQIELADEVLPDIFAQLVKETDDPFIQNIYDLAIPQMVFGRVCIIGDAAFFIRPHMAVGTAHAAADGLELAEALHNHDNLRTALQTWEDKQLELGHRLVQKAKRRGDIYTGNIQE